MTTKTDRELLAAWRETGDESAFAELVARHRQMVYRTSLRMLGQLKREEILRLIEELTPMYTEMADLRALPLQEFEKKQEAFNALIREKAKANPFVDVFATSLLVKYHAAAAQAQHAMLKAAIAFRLGGQTELEKAPDLFGEGPFAFESLPDGGFVLRSKLLKNGKPVTLMAGKSPKDSPVAEAMTDADARGEK